MDRNVLLSVLLLACAACSSNAPYVDPAMPKVPGETARSLIVDEERLIGYSVAGRPIAAHVLGDGEEIVMILASIHGSEPAGTPIVMRLIDHVRAHPELVDDKTLVVVPVVNPDGYAKRARHNDRGVDLNRNFPSTNRQNRRRFGPEGLSEPESRAIFDLLADFPPERVVSIHQPLACVDFDGPAVRVAGAMAAQCDLDVKRLGSRPGSLGSYVGVDLRVPIITFELRKGDENFSDAELWQKYGAALLAFLSFAG